MAMLRELSGWALLAVLYSVAGSAAAQSNATRGKQLYELTNASPLTCSNAACHGPNPATNTNKIQLGANNPVAIINAIANIPQMQFLDGPPTVFINTSNTVDASDLAAYIANPAAAAAAPAISLSAPALAFGATTVGMTNSTSTPTSITVTNTGNAPLTITGIAVSGTNAAEFAATGTCRPVAPATSVAVAAGATCTVGGSFTPTAAGNRTGTFTFQSNAAAAASPTIAVSGGTAGGSAPAPTPVTAMSPGVTSLKFNLQMVNTTSTVRSVVLTNIGSTVLTINQVTVTPAAFISSGCSGTFFPPGGQCTIQLYFAAPSATGTTSGSISIVSDAAGSPHTVSLSGGAVTTPTPDATLSDTTLTFDPLTTGQSGNKTATLTNLGNAPLMINSVSLSGPNAAEFKLASTSNCAAGALAISASCNVAVDFTPTAAGAKSATATVTHNASGGSSAVALTGTATAAGSGPGGSAVAPTDGGGGGWSPAWLASLALLAMLRPRRRGTQQA